MTSKAYALFPLTKLSHPNKVLFPSENITKQALAEYYKIASERILPFLKNHPLILQRFPEGIDGEGFIQQHPPEKTLSWLHTCRLPKKSGGTMEHMLCQDRESLLQLVNYDVITFHRWLSEYQKADTPSLIIFDLDPPPNRFDLVCKGAKLIKSILDKKNLHSFVMTTGSKGLHVVIPVKPQHSYKEISAWAKNIGHQITEKYPDEFTMEIRKEKRDNRVFIDTLRNAYGHSAVCPYSIRALPCAPIAAPLSWRELSSKLTSQKYNIKNIKQLLSKKDPWHDFEKYHNQIIKL